MEIVSEDGSQIRIKSGETREIGRVDGLNSSDKTVSRRHISFFMPAVENNQEIQLQFEVLGRNPIYVSKDNEVRIFRRFERGEMGIGDMFCVTAKNPVWYAVRKIENGDEGVRRNDLESELDESLESGFGFRGVEYLHPERVDISDVDPVKEFGFVVIGHEFDSYPKKMIKDMKNWDWFLDEEGKHSEDDEDGEKKRKGGRRKRKKGRENDDEEWTAESEDEKVLIDKARKAQKLKYSTRSKHHSESSKDKSKSKSPTRAKNRQVDEDEDDETLGGFIVEDENLEGEEEIVEEDEDEEEELADEDEDE